MIQSLDTNILIYTIDESAGEKFEIANHLFEQALHEEWMISTQVLGEFYAVATRKKMATREQAAELINDWSLLLKPITTSHEAFQKALTYAARTGTQFWDALILATCAQHGVTKLYTEDIGAQKQAMHVRLVNPFYDIKNDNNH